MSQFEKLLDDYLVAHDDATNYSFYDTIYTGLKVDEANARAALIACARPEAPRSLCGSSACKSECIHPEDCMQQSEPTPLTDTLIQKTHTTPIQRVMGESKNLPMYDDVLRINARDEALVGHARQLERKARVMQRELEKQTIPSPRGK